MVKKAKKTVVGSDYFRDLVDKAKLDDTSIVADGLGSAEFTNFIDTGSLSLNALLSARLGGGIPDNKVVAFAGESTTGKTWFALAAIKRFLELNPSAGVIYYDTEAAVTKEMMEQRGIDTTRIILAEPESIQAFGIHALRFLEAYGKTPEAERPPLMYVLDSLGALPSEKEVADTLEGKTTKDMTLQQAIKGTFRKLRLKLAAAHVPMIVTQHVYKGIGPYQPQQILSGGSGLRYAADEIILLKKQHEKDGKETIGNIITAVTLKSRITRENQSVQIRLFHRHGLDKWYGIKDIALRAGLLVVEGKKIKLPDGRLVWGKEIDDNPAEIFEPILEQLQEAVHKQFAYDMGSGEIPTLSDEDDFEDIESEK